MTFTLPSPRNVGIASTAAAVGVGVGSFIPRPANADSAAKQRTRENVGTFTASGLVFKDKVHVKAYSDPKVDGVTVYVSSVQRGDIGANWFSDPSATSISVVQTGPVAFKSHINLAPHGEDVISESKNLFFKTSHVRRLYDECDNALVYVAYNSKLRSNSGNKGDQYKTSVSVVPLGRTKPLGTIDPSE